MDKYREDGSYCWGGNWRKRGKMEEVSRDGKKMERKLSHFPFSISNPLSLPRSQNKNPSIDFPFNHLLLHFGQRREFPRIYL